MRPLGKATAQMWNGGFICSFAPGTAWPLVPLEGEGSVVLLGTDKSTKTRFRLLWPAGPKLARRVALFRLRSLGALVGLDGNRPSKETRRLESSKLGSLVLVVDRASAFRSTVTMSFCKVDVCHTESASRLRLTFSPNYRCREIATSFVNFGRPAVDIVPFTGRT